MLFFDLSVFCFSTKIFRPTDGGRRLGRCRQADLTSSTIPVQFLITFLKVVVEDGHPWVEAFQSHRRCASNLLKSEPSVRKLRPPSTWRMGPSSRATASELTLGSVVKLVSPGAKCDTFNFKAKLDSGKDLLVVSIMATLYVRLRF